MKKCPANLLGCSLPRSHFKTFSHAYNNCVTTSPLKITEICSIQNHNCTAVHINCLSILINKGPQEVQVDCTQRWGDTARYTRHTLHTRTAFQVWRKYMQEVLPLNRQLECRHVLMLVTGNGYKSVCDCVCCVCECVTEGWDSVRGRVRVYQSNIAVGCNCRN